MLLDTNLLLLPFQQPFPMIEALARWCAPSSLRVPSAVSGELERLERRGVAGARSALEFAGRFERIPSRAGGDGGLLELALRRGAVVATGDQPLRRRLVDSGVSVLFPRGGNRLELDPGRLCHGVRLREHLSSMSMRRRKGAR
ncbi:MAG: hypothetical protein L3K13_04445 [Thermoplasmata archaeon]|nr:hypothetical protein [Thermoplasmata archaeon]